jgi:hypothetical protein
MLPWVRNYCPPLRRTGIYFVTRNEPYLSAGIEGECPVTVKLHFIEPVA